MPRLPRNPLRKILFVDAATCALMGAALTIAHKPLAALMALPAGLLFYAGVILLPVSAFMLITACSYTERRPVVWLIIVGNGLWVAASFAVIFSPWIAAHALGYLFIVAQAVIVAWLAALEYLALRQAWVATS